MQKLSNEILKNYVDKDLLTCRKHPDKDLWVYGYTLKCAFENSWDEITSLGDNLILDSEDKVVAWPFKKIFNFGELETHKNYIKRKPLYVLGKPRGPIGTLFYYNDKWEFCIGNDFKFDKKIIKKYFNKVDLDLLPKDYTYNFVVFLYEDNKHIEYNNDILKLWMLSAYKKDETKAIEMPIDKLYDIAISAGFYMELYRFSNTEKTIKWLIQKPKEDFTDYILNFSDGTKLSLKYKFYSVLHQLVIDLTKRKEWEFLSEDLKNKLLSISSDKFYNWSEDLISSLLEFYVKSQDEILKDNKEIILKTNFNLKSKEDSIKSSYKKSIRNFHSIFWIINMINVIKNKYDKYIKK